jgi:hypothetical protein
LAGKKPIKRYIRPESISGTPTLVQPSVQGLLDDALSVIGSEIVRLKLKATAVNDSKPQGLNASEARMIQGYVKSLVELSRESRERTDDMDLANMSDEELLALVESIQEKKAIKGRSSSSDD